MWTEHLRDTKPVKGVFGENIPPLNGQLHEAILHQDGLKLRMDLNDFPKSAPKKWTEKNFNTAQITLLLSGLKSIAITAWSKDSTVAIEVAKAGADIQITVESPTAKITCTAATLSVLELTGYRKR